MNAKLNVRQKARMPMLVAVVVAALAMSACGPTEQADQARPLPGVGATVTTAGFNVTLAAKADPWVQDVALSPWDGTRWVGVTLVVTNVSDREQRWDSAVAVALLDADGRAYPMVNFDDPGVRWLRAAVVPAGGQVDGLVLFEVPVGVVALGLRVQGSVSAEGVTFELGGAR